MDALKKKSMDWELFYETNNLSIANIKKYVSNPGYWQKYLAACLSRHINSGSILEAGSGYGLTSLLVGDQYDRTLLDCENKALEGARSVFLQAKQKANFVLGSVFNMPFDKESFDLVFNAGVLEHFTFEERRGSLNEMARVTKKKGFIIIGIPNHFSLPYRYAYENLKAGGKWIYPNERRIYDLSEEFESIPGIEQITRETCDPFSSIGFVKNRVKRFQFLFRHILYPYEGYLTILTHRKV